MKMLHIWQRRTLAAVLAGTAAVMIGVAPFTIAQAAGTADAASGASTRPQMTRKMPPARPGTGQNARIDRMVQQGKITSEQADKLKKAISEPLAKADMPSNIAASTAATKTPAEGCISITSPKASVMVDISNF